MLHESKQEGFRFIQRLIDDYQSGENRFDQPGEAIYVCYIKSRLVGVCGLNRDKDLGQSRVGRLRRFYVLPEYRRQGIGRRLIEEILESAKGYFDVLQLRTDSEEADRFYQSMGFIKTESMGNATHYLHLGHQR
ncbi:GNAT family N-acetyltransferase [Paenibacillus alkalitolerans]|uniref:GNAT family N-acetyltransferase n=1 Tax=Paenibacillus alkalitolerans TaxID=2799335 RepID=UPI0018F33645